MKKIQYLILIALALSVALLSSGWVHTSSALVAISFFSIQYFLWRRLVETKMSIVKFLNNINYLAIISLSLLLLFRISHVDGQKSSYYLALASMALELWLIRYFAKDLLLAHKE